MRQKISSAHYSGIGEMIVTWARLESHVFNALRSLSGMKRKEAFIVFGRMGYREKINLLNDLVAIRHPDKQSQIRIAFGNLKNRLNDADTERNVVAHSVWFADKQSDALVPMSFKFKPENGGSRIQLRKQHKNYTSASFQKSAAEMNALAEDFKLFFRENFNVVFLHKVTE